MKRLIVLSALLFSASSALAFDDRRPVQQQIAHTIAVVAPVRDVMHGRESAIAYVGSYLRDALRREGFSAELVRGTVEDLERRRGREHDIVIELAWGESDGGAWGGVGTGGRVGSVGVGAEVSVVTARVGAEFRIYEGRSLELLDRFDLASFASGPALTGVGVGDRHGYLFLNLPFFQRAPYRRAARQVANEAAERIREDYRRP